MKKETFLIFTIGLFILAYVIDYISGPIAIDIKNPFQFLNPSVLTNLPLTTVGVGCRSLGIIIATVLFWSLFEGIYSIKAVTTFLISVLFELFAIQQIATGMRTVTIQWILSLAYSGVFQLIPAIIYLILSLVKKIPSNVVSTETSGND
jgi:hypothetical protein